MLINVVTIIILSLQEGDSKYSTHEAIDMVTAEVRWSCNLLKFPGRFTSPPEYKEKIVNTYSQ